MIDSQLIANLFSGVDYAFSEYIYATLGFILFFAIITAILYAILKK